mmetsp:Transcript_55478/g.91881  ORF Transcript_55478/g.91881 Transcript_55478/m.91881 type:complete len:93 (+) Transcript_55478:135-413(+)
MHHSQHPIFTPSTQQQDSITTLPHHHINHITTSAPHLPTPPPPLPLPQDQHITYHKHRTTTSPHQPHTATMSTSHYHTATTHQYTTPLHYDQ